MMNKYEKKYRAWLTTFFVSLLVAFSLFFVFSMIPDDNKRALTAIALLVLFFCGLTFLSLFLMFIYLFKRTAENKRIKRIEDSEAEDEKYICPNCKKAYSVKANFCPYCGAKKDSATIPEDVLFKGELSDKTKFRTMVKGLYYSSRIHFFLLLIAFVVFSVLVGISVAYGKINTSFYCFLTLMILDLVLIFGNYFLLPWIIVMKSKGKRQNMEINEKEILCTNIVKAGALPDSGLFELKYDEIQHAWKDKDAYYFCYRRSLSSCFVMTYGELNEKAISFLDRKVEEINRK